MAFVLDVVLEGEAAIQSAVDRIEKKLEKASKEATQLGVAFSDATQAVGTDYAKAAAKAGAASGTLASHLKKEREELQQTWRATQQYVNLLKDLEGVEKLRYKASKESQTILRQQLALMKDTGMQTRAHIEANMKATQAVQRLTAEQKLYTQALGKEQLLLESQVKHQKQMVVLAQERANKLSKLKAEIRYLHSEEGQLAAALEAQAAHLKQVAQEEQKRQSRISTLRSELKYLRTEEGQLSEALERRLKREKDLLAVQDRREAKLKDLRSELAYLQGAEGKSVSILEHHISATKAMNTLQLQREQRLKDLNAQLEHLSTKQGRETAQLEHRIKVAKQAATLDAERAQKVKDLQGQLAHLNTRQGKETTLLEQKIKAQKEALLLDEKRAARVKALESEIAHLSTTEGRRAAGLEHELKLAKEAAIATEKRAAKFKQLQADLAYVTSAEGKRTTAIEHQIKAAKDASLQEQKRADKLKSLAGELEYLRTAEGRRQTELEKLIAAEKRLGEEEAKRSARVEKIRAELQFLSTAEGRAAAQLEETLKQSKAIAVEEQRRSEKLRQLRSELEYLQSAEGKRSAELQVQIKAVRDAAQLEQQRIVALAKVREETEALNSGVARQLEVERAALALKKQLIKEETRQSAELQKTNQARETFSAALEKQIQYNKMYLEVMREQAKTDAQARLAKEGLIKVTDKHADTIEKLRREIEWLQTAEGKLHIEQLKQVAQLKKQKDALLDVERAAQRARTEARKFSTALGIANQAGASMRATMAGFGTTFGMFSSGTILVATATYGLASALRESLRAGVEFEYQMDRVVAIMDATGVNSVRLEQEVRQLAETTVFTAREVSDGLMYLGMAGLKTEDALTALEPSLRLASIGMLDMGTTADIVTNIMVGMGLQADQIAGIVDDMATAITNSNMDIQQLGNAMSYVAPLAREADISLQEIVASLEVLHNSGIKASRAGTAMRTTMLSLLAPTAEATEVLMKYGIEVDDHTGRMRNWTDLLGEMASAQMTLADIEAIVGKRQAAGMKAMIDSAQATEEWTKKAKAAGYESAKTGSQLQYLTEQLHRNSGAAAVMQAVMEDNLRGDWLKLLSALEEKFLEFYELNKEQLQYMVNNATEFVKALDVNEVHDYFHTLLGYLKEGAQYLAMWKGLSLGFQAGQAMIYGGTAAVASAGALQDWVSSKRKSSSGSSSGTPGGGVGGLSSMIVDSRGNPIQSSAKTPYRDISMGTALNYGSMLIPGFGWANAGRVAIQGARTAWTATKAVAPAALTIGAPLAGAYAANQMYSAGAGMAGDVAGPTLSAQEAYFENRLRKYSAMTEEELRHTQQNMEQAIANAGQMMREAQASYEENLAMGEHEVAQENLQFIEQMNEKVIELANSLNILGVAREQSGMFGDKAEAEVAYNQALVDYNTALSNQSKYANLPESVLAQPEMQAKLAEYGDQAAQAKERMLEAARQLSQIQEVELEREEKIRGERQAQGSIVAETAIQLDRQAKIDAGLVSNSALLAENRRKQKEYEETKFGLLTKQVPMHELELMARRDVSKLTEAELAQQQALFDKHKDILGSANDAKHSAQQLLKLKAEERQLLEKIRQEGEKRSAQEERRIQQQNRAIQQARNAYEQSRQRAQSLEDEFLMVEYRNEAYERGILLMDDEEFLRMRALEQQQTAIEYAEKDLAIALAKAEVIPEEVEFYKKRVDEEKKVLELLGRQKAEISEARRFAEQQHSSLASMYSTIESETIGLLERGFKDTQSYFDSIVGSFKRMLAELAYQAAIKPIIVNMVASVGGMMGMGSASQKWAADQGVTVGGGFGNLVDMGKSAWSFWKNGGQADVSWFNDFATSGVGQAIGLSTAGAVTTTTSLAGGGVALSSPVPSLAGSALPMSPVAPPVGSFANTVGGQSVTTVAPATLTGTGSFLSNGLQASPWGAVGAIGANLMGIQGSGNAVIDTVLTTGGSIVGGGIGASLGAKFGMAAGGPIGAAVGAVLGTALGGVFKKKPSNKEGRAFYDLATDKISITGQSGKKYSQENRDAAEQISELIAGNIIPTLEALSGDEIGGNFVVGVGNRDPLRFLYRTEDSTLSGGNWDFGAGRNNSQGHHYSSQIFGNTRDPEKYIDNVTRFFAAEIAKLKVGVYDTLGMSGEGYIDTIRRIEGGKAAVEGFGLDFFGYDKLLQDVAVLGGAQFTAPDLTPAGTSEDLYSPLSGILSGFQPGVLTQPEEFGRQPGILGGLDSPLSDTLSGFQPGVLTQPEEFGRHTGIFGDIQTLLSGTDKPNTSAITSALTDAFSLEGLEGESLEFAENFIDALNRDLKNAAESYNAAETEETLSEVLEGIFNDAIASLEDGDGLAGQVLGDMLTRDIHEAFAQAEETALETTMRVVGNFELLDGAMDKLGHEIQQTGLDAFHLTENLIELSGGIETLAANLDTYYQNFYSQEEITSRNLHDLSEALNDLGYGIPAVRDEFRALVDALYEAGDMEGYATLINNSGAFADYYSAQEQIAGSIAETYQAIQGFTPHIDSVMHWVEQIMDGSLTLSQALQYISQDLTAVNAVADSTSISYANITAGAQEAYDAYQATLKGLSESYENQSELLQAQQATIQAQQNLVDQIRTTIQNLKLSDVSPLTPIQRLSTARSGYYDMLGEVQAGNYDNSGELLSNAQTYIAEAASYYASSGPYQSIFNSVIGALEDLGIDLESEISASEASQQAIEEAMDSLESTMESEQAKALKAYQDQLMSLMRQEDTLTSIEALIAMLPPSLSQAFVASLPEDWTSNVNAVAPIVDWSSGTPEINDEWRAPTEEIAGLKALYEQYAGGLTTDNAGKFAWYSEQLSNNQLQLSEMEDFLRIRAEEQMIASTIDKAYKEILGGAADVRGFNQWAEWLMDGTYSAEDMRNRFNEWADGSHAKGLGEVPVDGYRAILHKGEMVLPEPVAKVVRNAAVVQSQSSNVVSKELLEELRALRTEVAALREDQAKIGVAQVTQLQEQTAEIKSGNRRVSAK